MKTAQILDFNQEKIRRAQLKDQELLRTLAKKVVDTYYRHGEDAYCTALLSITRGDKEFTDVLLPFIEAEITGRNPSSEE